MFAGGNAANWAQEERGGCGRVKEKIARNDERVCRAEAKRPAANIARNTVIAANISPRNSQQPTSASGNLLIPGLAPKRVASDTAFRFRAPASQYLSPRQFAPAPLRPCSPLPPPPAGPPDAFHDVAKIPVGNFVRMRHSNEARKPFKTS